MKIPQKNQRVRARRIGAKPLVERRFPLHLEPTILSIRTLYDQSKAARWDPERSIAWRNFQSAHYSSIQRSAAALTWSRRVWTEYSGFAETPSILIRFCLEHEGESDPKMFLTVRGTEESWHVECAYRFSKLLGGYIDAPKQKAYATLLSQDNFRHAFDPGLVLTAYLAANAVMLDGMDLELYRGYLRHAKDNIAVSILRRLVEDKERHVAFGWAYLKNQRDKGAFNLESEYIISEIDYIAQEIILGGYYSPFLAPPGMADEIIQADEITFVAGLGATTEEQELPMIRQYFEETRTHFQTLGLTLGEYVHERYGSF